MYTVPFITSVTQSIELSAPWQVYSIPGNPHPLIFEVPACTHLQTALYPDQPYWGQHLRELNNHTWVYHQRFTVPDGNFRRVRLVCEGIDYFAAVWLNGAFVGEHEGGFAPFSVDITDNLCLTTENELTIHVSAPWDTPNPHGTYPVDHVIRGLVKGLYEHGEGVIPPDVNPLGIWRPVRLVFDAGISLDHVQIVTDLTGDIYLTFTATNSTDSWWQGKLALDVAGENHSGAGVSTCTPLNLAPGTAVFTQTLELTEPQLWWPWDHGQPNLYRLTASLIDNNGSVQCTHEELFGVRTVRLERTRDRFTYWINEHPVYVRGSSYIPALYLSQCNREQLTRDLDLVRNANLNLLRVHVHVSVPELYELCDRAGILIWQDFELNWTQDPSPEFEQRALALQQGMINLLGNHPSVITWACHNEPTMLYTRRENLEQHPAPALYRNARQQDCTRPVFICSGQLEGDWERSGDAHSYYGAIWSKHYTDVYRHKFNLNTEFGAEVPASPTTLSAYPECWERLKHLVPQTDTLWRYQAELIQFHVEHFRRLRAQGMAGFVHFWLVDLAPQVGCGVLDVNRHAKSGYEALRIASQPLHVAMEHDGKRPYALWVFNDTNQSHSDVRVCWYIFNKNNQLIHEGSVSYSVAANRSQQVMQIRWPIQPRQCNRITLALYSAQGEPLTQNSYDQPFEPSQRPKGYPWKFDPVLGCKVFDRPDAKSLANLNANWLIRLIPLSLREPLAEWALRQKMPSWMLTLIARLARYVMG